MEECQNCSRKFASGRLNVHAKNCKAKSSIGKPKIVVDD